MPDRFQKKAVANSKQVSGTHYKSLNPEPWDVAIAWKLPYLLGCVVKYLARFTVEGDVDDLKKAVHYLEKLIETEEA